MSAFARSSAAGVNEIGPSLALRDPDGEPVRMGFAVGAGPAAVSLMTGAIVTVLGDATNVTFRLSGIAGRSGWPDVVVTDAVHELPPEIVSPIAGPPRGEVKGRLARSGSSAWPAGPTDQPSGATTTSGSP